jgi:hypothetical protein
MLHRVTSDKLHFKVIIRSTNQFKISVQNYGISDVSNNKLDFALTGIY